MRASLRRIFLLVILYSLVVTAVILTAGNTDDYILSGAENRGLQLYRQYNCMVCHSLYGLGGHIGPDLTNVSSRFDENYIKISILKGRRKMQSCSFNEYQLYSMLLYLKMIDSTATYPLIEYPEDYFGRFEDKMKHNGR